MPRNSTVTGVTETLTLTHSTQFPKMNCDPSKYIFMGNFHPFKELHMQEHCRKTNSRYVTTCHVTNCSATAGLDTFVFCPVPCISCTMCSENWKTNVNATEFWICFSDWVLHQDVFQNLSYLCCTLKPVCPWAHLALRHLGNSSLRRFFLQRQQYIKYPHTIKGLRISGMSFQRIREALFCHCFKGHKKSIRAVVGG